MNTGTVKFYSEWRRFGTIIDNQTSEEYYVHGIDLIDDIEQGDQVTFELKEISRGYQVVNVRVV